jgi:LysM repeat protein
LYINNGGFFLGKFKEPSNIKQIGSIDQNSKTKIYIEDYAYSYVQKYIKDGNYDERLAFLIGEIISDGKQDIILISAVVCAIHTNHYDGILNITPETWNYVNQQITKYFNGLEVVGLAQSQPGYGVYLNEKYVAQFKNNFNKLNQVFFVCDPIERLGVFHIFDSLREQLLPISGYFIFYSKNSSMNEFIISQRKVKLDASDICYNISDDTTNDIKSNHTQQTKKIQGDQKKTVNLLASLSAVIFLICFVMGAGLIQNEGRISKLESRIQVLNNLYKELNNTESVFSSQINKTTISPQIIKDVTTSDSSNKNKSYNNRNKSDFDTKSLKEDEENIFNISPVSTTSSLSSEKNNEHDNNQKKNPTETISNNTAERKTNKLPETYTVHAGDSLGSISIKFFGDLSMVDEIMKINGMDNPDMLYSGKVLELPRNVNKAAM